MCSMFVKLLILHPLIPVAMGGVLPTVGIPLSNGMRPGRDLPPCLCLHLLLLCPPWLSAALRMPLLLLSAFWRMWPLLCSSCGRNPAKVRRQAFKSLSPVATQTRQGASYNLRALHHTHKHCASKKALPRASVQFCADYRFDKLDSQNPQLGSGDASTLKKVSKPCITAYFSNKQTLHSSHL